MAVSSKGPWPPLCLPICHFQVQLRPAMPHCFRNQRNTILFMCFSSPNLRKSHLIYLGFWLQTFAQPVYPLVELGECSVSEANLVSVLAAAALSVRPRSPRNAHRLCATSHQMRFLVGSCRFRLLNMRQAVRFVLLRNGFEFPTPAAHSQQITVANPNEPTGGHLALTGQQGYSQSTRPPKCMHVHANLKTMACSTTISLTRMRSF